MYQLRLFGSAEVFGPDGRLYGRIAQRRQLALLAALALSAGRAVSRDRLLVLFWPEADTDRARHNLADAVYHVRRALGDDAVLSVGDDLALNPSLVASDVAAFDEALARNEPEVAVRIYSAPLLDGFHLSGAPGFEHWLDGERSRFARTHAVALEKLAVQSRENGRLEESAAWWERLARAEPLSSRIALSTMRALADAGERAAAIRHAQVHAAHLETELEAGPDPDVSALADELMPSLDGARDERRAVGPRRVDGEIRGTPFVSVDDSTQVQERRSRARRVAIGLLLGAAAIACFAFVLNRDGEAGAMVGDRIIVLPFTTLAGIQDSTHLGAWIAHLITLGIVQAEIGDPVLPHEFAAWNGSHSAAGGDAIERAAEVFSAGIVVSGTMQRHGDVVDVDAVLHAGPNRTIAIDPVRVAIRNARLDVDALRQRVVGALAAHLARGVAAHPYVVESPTLASFRAVERANRLFLDRSFVRAAQEFRRAWQLDTTATGFLMWAGIAYLNAERDADVDSILSRLLPRRIRLARLDAAHLDWLVSVRDGDRAGALRAARDASALAPNSGLGGYQVGFELLKSGRPEEGAAVFDSLDPERGWLRDWSPYWRRFAFAYHLVGRPDDEMEVIRRTPERHRQAQPAMEIVALAARLDVPALLRAIEDSGNPSLAYIAAKELLVHGGDTMDVEAIATLGLRLLRQAPTPADASAARRRSRLLLEARLSAHAAAVPHARDLFRTLHRELPNSVVITGWLGVASARLGDHATAAEMLARLEAMSAQDPRGLQFAWQAAVHANLPGAEATHVRALLERARQLGVPFDEFHDETVFGALRLDRTVRGFFEAG